MDDQRVVPAPYPNASLDTFSFVEEHKEYWEPILEGTVEDKTACYFIHASKDGDLNKVKALVEEEKIDPESCRDTIKASPLHYASLHGNFNIVQYLVEQKKCNMLCKTIFENTPLHHAALNGKKMIVEYLISERGCDPTTCRGWHGRTPLHLACQSGSLCLVEYFIKNTKNCDPMIQDNDGATPLHVAALFGKLPTLKYLLEECECDIKCRDSFMNAPLHYAAAGGQLDVVQYLISERGCDPMCKDKDGRTVLHGACRTGNLDVVEYLIMKAKVEASCQDDNENTPLHVASKHTALNVVKYLIEEKKCNKDAKNKWGSSPIHYATMGGNLSIMEYLIGRGCDKHSRGRYGRTPLHYACANNHIDVVIYLIKDLDVETSCTDDYGHTPLHIAASAGYLAVVKLLVDNYLCDHTFKDKKGPSPAKCAKNGGHTHVLSYLTSFEKIAATDLNKALVTRLKPYIKRAKPTRTVLGSGTYGSVIELKTAGEDVAGKIFRMTSTAQLQRKAKEVCEEVIMMLNLSHPNIVQCKGVSLLVDHPLPVLLMERLTTSLHAYLLHQDNSNLPLKRKVSILLDTASGLEYLHNRTTAIIHQDLTAKNVLLIVDSKPPRLRAKITDFGNSRIMDLDPESSPKSMTGRPGTLEYMPPEAQGGNVSYDPSLDVFSFGHLSLFTITQTLIAPLLPFSYTDPSTGELRARSEVKRREKSVKVAKELLSDDHSLVAVIEQCLHNSPARRPHIGELVAKFCEVMNQDSANGSDTPQYRAVLKNFVPLASTIEATPEALEDLQRHFKAKFWLSPTAKPNADGLGTLALNRIEMNVDNYDVYMEILSSITGLDEIMDIIRKEQYSKGSGTDTEQKQKANNNKTRYGPIICACRGLHIVAAIMVIISAFVVYYSIPKDFGDPVIEGANITRQTTVDIPPGKEFNYVWDQNGIEIDIPAGAISTESGPVTLIIQASYSGDYQFPDDSVLVSAVYWLTLNPPVKLAKNVTIRIQHCADNNSSPFIVTAQEILPYKFKPLSGGEFTYPDCDSTTSYGYGHIQVEHFSAMAVVSEGKAYYAFRTFYLPSEEHNSYEFHITVTPNLEQHVEAVREEYNGRKGEEGHYVLAKIENDEISLYRSEVGIPNSPWKKDGWEISPLILPPTLEKDLLDEYQPKTLIPYLALELRMTDPMKAQRLTEEITFSGIKPRRSIVISRVPQPATAQEASPGACLIKDWLKEEPSIKLLNLITYTNSRGTQETFELIIEIQNDCARIGTQLGIQDSTIKSLRNEHKQGADFCREILIKWRDKGVEVTWARLLKVLKDLDHGRVAQNLEMALC